MLVRWSCVLKAVSDFEKKKKKKIVVLCSLAPQNVKLDIFMLWFARTAEKCTRKRAARAKDCFTNLNLLLFCRSHCRRRRRTASDGFLF